MHVRTPRLNEKLDADEEQSYYRCVNLVRFGKVQVVSGVPKWYWSQQSEVKFHFLQRQKKCKDTKIKTHSLGA